MALAYLMTHYPRLERHHEDIVQDALVKLLERGQTSPEPALLVEYAKNLARNRVKSVDSRLVKLQSDPLGRPSDET